MNLDLSHNLLYKTYTKESYDIESLYDLNNITSVNISKNGLTEIPNWIKSCNNLRILNISENNLIDLPIWFNCLKLEWFVCYKTNIFDMVDKIPLTLKGLNCSSNYNLKILPKSPLLEELICDNTKILKIPEYELLKKLRCGRTLIKELPNLPSLTILDCSFNRLSKLPNLPNLTSLDCSFNKLSELSILPDCLKILNCSNNQIKILPDKLPNSLVDLDFKSNQIKFFPKNLPPFLKKLSFYNNQIKSIPLEIINCDKLKLTHADYGLNPINASIIEILEQRYFVTNE
jgi:Leucine-rich repeat (LRR) protein